jgi:hypothetical protein
MVGLFVPDDMSKWPAIDPKDPTYQRDLASLQVRGEAVGMDHGHMNHDAMNHESMHMPHPAGESHEAPAPH